MKILLTADPHLPVPPTLYGGIERIVDALVVDLRKRGHTVGLVAHPESTVSVDFFVAWPAILPISAAEHLRNSIALWKGVREFQPALVHSFSRLLYLSPFLPLGIGKIMSYQRSTGGTQIRIAALLAGRSLAYTGCSGFIADMGRRHGGTWHAIPNFVDVDRYAFRPSVPDDAPLVFLGRVEPIKGAHLAIEIAKRTGRRLLVAGNHAESGVEGEYWETRIKPELGKNGIEYVGPVDDHAKNELLGSAAAMVVPIQWDEPFGIVFAEALACGTPVISCPRGAVPEIVRNGVDGFIVRDTEEACRALHGISSIDRRECRLRAERAFSAAAVVPRYEALYRALLAGREPVAEAIS
jgi:glycosyltransferase involved in cell wall biosynthesis